MTTVTLEQIHEDLVGIKEEIAHLREVVDEEFELSTDVLEEIQVSKRRPASAMISHEDMRKEFG